MGAITVRLPEWVLVGKLKGNRCGADKYTYHHRVTVGPVVALLGEGLARPALARQRARCARHTMTALRAQRRGPQLSRLCLRLRAVAHQPPLPPRPPRSATPVGKLRYFSLLQPYQFLITLSSSPPPIPPHPHLPLQRHLLQVAGLWERGCA